jgi:hypothetical protein
MFKGFTQGLLSLVATVRLGFVVALLSASLTLSGCVGAGCSASNTMSGQEGVCNNEGSFSYSTNASMTTKSDTYTWKNPATKANINWAVNMGLGAASISINDATGKQVYTKSFQGSGQQSSSATSSTGEPGDWTITVRLSGASGQVAFNVNAS